MEFISEYLTFTNTILLFVAGIVTGFINTVAGGGSLLTLPLLMFMGLSHTEANGTNRIGILMQSIGAVAGFRQKKITSFPLGFWQGMVAVFGAIIGTYVAIYISADVFKNTLALIIVLVVCLMLFNPKGIQVNCKNARIQFILSLFIFFLIGIYGGFIQAGLGFLSMLASTTIDKINIHKANHAKVFVTLCISVVAITIFIYQDLVIWSLGIVLALGSTLGSYGASHWSVNNGEKAVKIFLFLTAIVVAVKLVFFS